MTRDKLITIRIESEKREAFKELAKSQNTDTASLLYDFISGCLDGKIDIGIVTGKGNRIDNQIGSNRLDKLETDTQRIDHWIGALSERVNDWILRSDRRVNDCEKELSEKMVSLEHRLNALSIQLDSQRIDSIDTDSQQIDDMEPLIKEALRLDHLDDQSLIDAIESRIEDTEIDESDYESVPSPFPTIGGNPDMEPVATVETAIDKVETADTVEAVTEKDESVYTVESVDKVESVSTVELDKDAIGPVTGDSSHLNNQLCEGMNAADAYRYLTSKGVKVSEKTLSDWISKKKHIPMTGKGDAVSEYLIMKGGLYYPSTD